MSGPLQIRRFTPDDADDVRAALAIVNAAAAVDTPWEPPQLLAHFEAELRHGWDGDPDEPFLGLVAGEPVAVGALNLPERDNRHYAWLSVDVHPDHRRRGYGSALLEDLLARARAAGRATAGIEGWESAATYAFAERHGFDKKSQAIMRRQHLGEVDPAVVRALYDESAGPAASYELVRVVGRTPDDLVEAVTDLTAAINDAPTDDLDVEDEVFTPERLTAYEDAVLARGNRMYRLVARHRETGELGGHTVVAVDGARPVISHQHDTAVARGHRGHRLGLLLKSAMLLWLADVEPQIETVDTWNAESNDHMIAVNERLGYRVVARELQFEKPLAPRGPDRREPAGQASLRR
jgi:GNAT superfamily N-acetyltransferase